MNNLSKIALAIVFAAGAFIGPAANNANAQGYYYNNRPTFLDRLVGNGYGSGYGSSYGYGNYNYANYGNNGWNGWNGYNNCRGWGHHHHHHHRHCW